MHINNSTKLLGLKDLEIINVVEEARLITIESKHIHERTCPFCGSNHNWVHDHRTQSIKDSPMRKKKVILKVKKTRYNCKCCGKRFEPRLSFMEKGRQTTKRLVEYIVESIREIRSSTKITEEIGISVSSVLRIIDFLKIPRKPLGEVLCIDEFKGDSGGNKYQTTIADGKKREVLDILPSRFSNDLDEYLTLLNKKKDLM